MMGLTNDLIAQFVKATKDTSSRNTESTVYGTVVESDGTTYVQIDGSDQLTPVSTTTNIKSGERVTVLIKDHTATVTGNLTAPSASNDDINDVIGEFDVIVGDRITVEEFNAEVARIDTLIADTAIIKGQLTAVEADIGKLEADNVTVTEKLTAAEANITKLTTEKLDADFAEITYATIAELEAVDAKIYNLDATYATITELEAVHARIDDLDVTKLSVTDADLKYANIDFANIGDAAIENLFAKSGMLEDLVVSEGHVTGTLVGVTIKGDLIEGGTIVADKLVIQGEDGLYYKLNTDGVSIEAEQTEYNSLNGSVITAKSITAEKINVTDLVAFDATIGGFSITDKSLYSGVKESVDNSTRGTYLDVDGQVAFGDADNYLRYYKTLDEDGNEVYKLEISAESILFGGSSKSSAADLKVLTEHVKIGTYVDPVTGDEQPSVELAEGDSDFRQVITNVKTMFMDGSKVGTEINTDGIETENLTVRGEYRQHEWAWARRANGNFGLTWKEVAE